MDAPVCGRTKAELKRLGITEKGTQAYLLDRLQALEVQGKCWFFRNNSFSGTITRYNGSRGFVKNNKPGAPDVISCFKLTRTDGVHIVGITYGHFVGWEVKGPTGRLEASQQPAHDAIRKAGGTVYVVYCPEDVEIYLKELGY